MTVGAVTFDLGGAETPVFSIPDSSGLMPLSLPEELFNRRNPSLPHPSSDAVMRFEAAMDAAPSLTRLAAIKDIVAAGALTASPSQGATETIPAGNGEESPVPPENPVAEAVADVPERMERGAEPHAPVEIPADTARKAAAPLEAKRVSSAQIAATSCVDSMETVQAPAVFQADEVPFASVHGDAPVADVKASAVPVMEQSAALANESSAEPVKKIPVAVAVKTPADEAIVEGAPAEPVKDASAAVAGKTPVSEVPVEEAPAEPVRDIPVAVVGEVTAEPARGYPVAAAEAPAEPSKEVSVAIAREVPAEPIREAPVAVVKEVPVEPAKDAPAAVVRDIPVAAVAEPALEPKVVVGPPPEIVSAPEAAPARDSAQPEKTVMVSSKSGVALDKAEMEDEVVVFEAEKATPSPLQAMPVFVSADSTGAVDAQSATAREVSAISAAAARTEAVVEVVNELIEAVVSQISVTPSLVQGEGEVRMTLKANVLDGSDVVLSAKDGSLSVVVTPATPEAAQVVAAAVPRLEVALAEHVPTFRQVAVKLVSRKGSSDEIA